LQIIIYKYFKVILLQHIGELEPLEYIPFVEIGQNWPEFSTNVWLYILHYFN